MDLKDLWVRFARKEISAKEFAKEATKYFESPEGRQQMARIESKRLKDGKAGRARLFELIEEYRKKGYEIDYEFYPLPKGGNSVLVKHKVKAGWASLGFPDSFCPEIVERHFLDFITYNREGGTGYV